MQSRVKFAGHPVHPMLVVFPLGLLGTAVIFDIIYLISDNSQWTVAAHYMIGAGLVGGLAAALFGWLDWVGVPSGTRAKRIGLWHGLGNVAVLALFLLSWALRRDNPAMPPTGAIVAGLSAIMLAIIAGALRRHGPTPGSTGEPDHCLVSRWMPWPPALPSGHG